MSPLRLTLGLCAALNALAGCGGGSQPPIGAPGTMPQSRAIAAHVEPGGSWMLPGASKIGKLLYISDLATNDVYVYNYGTGALVGMLTGFSQPSGQCVDAKGDVWIPNYGGKTILEYVHGGTQPIKSLATDPDVRGCSVSPNGDLAVDAHSVSSSSYLDEIQVWHHASGSPTNYPGNSRCSQLYPPGYDKSGNLFSEGLSSDAYLCELPAGGDSLQFLFVQRGQICCGSVMWDGRHIALTMPASGRVAFIFRVKEIDSYDVKIVGRTKLTGKCDNHRTETGQPFIVGDQNTPINRTIGSVVVSGNELCQGLFNYWRYPQGGHRFAFLRSPPRQPSGQSVSLAPSR